jgi:tRNA modification GTPase
VSSIATKMSTEDNHSDTIAAIATAAGVSSISIVRVSGSQAVLIAKRVAKDLSTLTPRYAHLTSLYNKEEILIDKGIVLYFQTPHSFTGEEIVEFQCHGGLIVAQEILDTLIVYGARLATPGEFSKRAFLNGKIDLSEAEAIGKLIEAKSLQAAKILAKQMKGEVRHFVEESRELLLKAMAHSEVMIDYADEDLPETLTEGVATQLEVLTEKLEKLVLSSHARRGLLEGFKVAIIGKPNVGKSSLLNAFLAYDRAIVSDIAGTTRDTIEEQIRIGSHLIRLVDTAGIRESEDSIEKIGIERSLSSIEEADVVIALFDGSRTFEEEDEAILHLLEHMVDKHLIVAINKSDLPQHFPREVLSSYTPLEVSAKRDFKRLTTALEKLFTTIGDSDELLLASHRQIEAVKQTAQELKSAKLPLQQGELEFFSYHIQEAIKSLSSLSKPYNSEEILDKMFGEFCLGK